MSIFVYTWFATGSFCFTIFSNECSVNTRVSSEKIINQIKDVFPFLVYHVFWLFRFSTNWKASLQAQYIQISGPFVEATFLRSLLSLLSPCLRGRRWNPERAIPLIFPIVAATFSEKTMIEPYFFPSFTNVVIFSPLKHWTQLLYCLCTCVTVAVYVLRYARI